MSAVVLLCVFILGTRVGESITTRNGDEISPKIGNQTLFQDETGLFVSNSNRKIVIEEVDKHGNAVVKELELPDYDESKEEQQSKKSVKISKERNQNKNGGASGRTDLYGCHNRKESQRKKCLQRKKRLIKGRYKSWKALFRQIIKDLDGKIKTIK